MYQDCTFRVAKVVADHYGLLTQWVYSVPIFNLFVTSKNETANAPIHELKVRVLRFYLKGLKNIWQHFEFVNLWIYGFVTFDVTNRLVNHLIWTTSDPQQFAKYRVFEVNCFDLPTHQLDR